MMERGSAGRVAALSLLDPLLVVTSCGRRDVPSQCRCHRCSHLPWLIDLQLCLGNQNQCLCFGNHFLVELNHGH